MRRTKFDYRSYHGKRTATDWLKWIALILAILAALAVAVLLWGQKYFTYTDEGLRLTLPLLQQEGRKPADPGQVDVVIEEEEPKEDASHPVEPHQPEETTAAAAVPLSALLDGSAAALAEQAGANSVVVEMKDVRGRLGWQSEQPLAGAAKLPGAEAPGINEQLAAWNQGGLDTIARLSCFRDHALAKDETYAIRTNSGYRWTDPEELRWSSPASQAVQDYLVALMVELAQLGFDEILLDNWGYPAEGNLGYIKQGNAYDLEHLSQPVEEFLARAEAALEPYGTRLALRSTWAVLEGDESPGGQTAQLLERYAQRVWLEAPEDGMADLLSQAGLPEGEERLALLVEELDPDLDCSQGIWDPEA